MKNPLFEGRNRGRSKLQTLQPSRISQPTSLDKSLNTSSKGTNMWKENFAIRKKMGYNEFKNLPSPMKRQVTQEAAQKTKEI